MVGQFMVMDCVSTGGVEHRYYFDGLTATFKRYETFTSGPGYELILREVVPLRAEDYPVLAEIWDNDEDDAVFGDGVAS